jgi:putative Holliday junction resolvase
MPRGGPALRLSSVTGFFCCAMAGAATSTKPTINDWRAFIFALSTRPACHNLGVGSPNRRILSLDVGLRRIGLALADEHGAIATLDVLKRGTMAEDVKRLAKIAQERRITLLLVGLPLNMDGTEGHMAEFIRTFVERLRKGIEIEIALQDERLSSVEAEDRLRDAGLSLKRMLEFKRRGGVDRLAAVILLEDYLRSHPVFE